ncbi:MAG: hypothetical protein PHD48_04415 [Alphaproteobacteria bacterium]|nr:hypothetical protein [Alphaproteobacteria bacterium]
MNEPQKSGKTQFRQALISPKDSKASPNSLSTIATPFDAIPLGNKGISKRPVVTMGRNTSHSLSRRIITATLAIGIFTTALFVPVNKSDAKVQNGRNQEQTKIHKTHSNTALTAAEEEILTRSLQAVRDHVDALRRKASGTLLSKKSSDKTIYLVSQAEEVRLQRRIQEIRESVFAKRSHTKQKETQTTRAPESIKNLFTVAAPPPTEKTLIPDNNDLCKSPFDLVQFLYPNTTKAPAVRVPEDPQKRATLQPVPKKTEESKLFPIAQNTVCKHPFDLANYLRTNPATKTGLGEENVTVPILTAVKKIPVLKPKSHKIVVKQKHNTPRVKVTFQVEERVPTTKQDVTARQKGNLTQQPLPKPLQPAPKPRRDKVSGILASKFGLSQDVFSSLNPAEQKALTNATLSGAVTFVPYKQSMDETTGTNAAVTMFNVADKLAKNATTRAVAVKMYKQACDVACNSNYLMTREASASVTNYAKLLQDVGREPHAVYLACIAVQADNTNREALKLLVESSKKNPDLVEQTYSRVSRMNAFGLFGNLNLAAQNILEKTVQSSQNNHGRNARPVTYNTNSGEPYRPTARGTAWDSFYHVSTNS